MTEVKMMPLGPRFIAKKYEVEPVTEGGILLTEGEVQKIAREQPECTIIRASDSLKKEYGDLVAPGRKVLLGVTPRSFIYNGEEFWMVDWAMVKGIYE